MKTICTALSVLILSSGLVCADPEPFGLDGFALDSPTTENPNFTSYQCTANDTPSGLSWCRQPDGKDGLSRTVIQSSGHSAVYIMASARRVSLTRDAALQEIDDLSRRMAARPTTVLWPPMSHGRPAAVIALWGKIKLEDVRETEIGEIAAGNVKDAGILVDTLGDPVRSAREGLPVYRIVGGRGSFYAGTVNETGQGYRQYAAVNATAVTKARASSELQAIVRRDRELARDDYSLWPEVATVVRRFALAASTRAATELIDEVFPAEHSTKLYSRIWPVLPGGPIEHLGAGQHFPVDIYPPNSPHRAIRRDILYTLSRYPSEPFSELLHYVLGDFEVALQTNPNSVISGVLHYILGRRALEPVLQDVVRTLKPKNFQSSGLTGIVAFLNANPDVHGRKPLVSVMPDFASRVGAAEAHFAAAIRNSSDAHADDAAYFLGWLAYHRGDSTTALKHFSQAIEFGNPDHHDYRRFALIFAIRILADYPASERFAKIEGDAVLAKEPAMWYGAARASYRKFDYPSAVDLARRALTKLSVDVGRLPATTDPVRIQDDLSRTTPDPDSNLAELPYLLQASLELMQFEASLVSVANEPSGQLFERVKAIVFKYSKLREEPEPPDGTPAPIPKLAHADYRQAIRLLDVTLKAVPQQPQYAKLREWAHYRKVRVFVAFAPREVAKAVAAMEQEFPASSLLDDALAEQLYAEGVVLRDLSAARATFQRLRTQFKTANAIDNAYSWMAIILRCEGRVGEANIINREILTTFRSTRHAGYARERLKTPLVTRCLFWGTEPVHDP